MIVEVSVTGTTLVSDDVVIVLYVTIVISQHDLTISTLINHTRASRSGNDGRYRDGLGRWRWNDYCSWRLDCYWNGFDSCVSDLRSFSNRNNFSRGRRSNGLVGHCHPL